LVGFSTYEGLGRFSFLGRFHWGACCAPGSSR
jgi:hypothetical protein